MALPPQSVACVPFEQRVGDVSVYVKGPGLHAVMAVLATSAKATTAAEAAVVTFNDLGPSPFGIRMPNAYGGLRWGGAGLSDWHFMTSGSDPTDNFLALSGTGTFVGAPLGGADFYFEGADFWS